MSKVKEIIWGVLLGSLAYLSCSDENPINNTGADKVDTAAIYLNSCQLDLRDSVPVLHAISLDSIYEDPKGIFTITEVKGPIDTDLKAPIPGYYSIKGTYDVTNLSQNGTIAGAIQPRIRGRAIIGSWWTSQLGKEQTVTSEKRVGCFEVRFQLVEIRQGDSGAVAVLFQGPEYSKGNGSFTRDIYAKVILF